jgi:opacity protein-like surface antigen
MKQIILKIIFAVIVLLTFNINLRAQSNSSGFEVGAHVTAFIYQGDLAPDVGSYKTIAPGIGVFGSYRFNQNISFRANLAVGNLRGDDAKYTDMEWRQDRSLKFSTSVTEVSGLFVWDFNRNVDNRNDFKIIPYVMGGFGFSFLDVKPDYSKATIRLTEITQDEATPKPKSMLVIPVGAGVRYVLSENISLNIESKYRLASQTDYLDGVSIAGTPQRNDYYYTISLGIIYNLSGDGGNGAGGKGKKKRWGKGNRKAACAAYQ